MCSYLVYEKVSLLGLAGICCCQVSFEVQVQLRTPIFRLSFVRLTYLERQPLVCLAL
jgi:hypothetical protein